MSCSLDTTITAAPHIHHLNAELACDNVPHAHVSTLVHHHHFLLEGSVAIRTHLSGIEHTTVDSSARLYAVCAYVRADIPNLATLVISSSVQPFELSVESNFVHSRFMCFRIGKLRMTSEPKNNFGSLPLRLCLKHFKRFNGGGGDQGSIGRKRNRMNRLPMTPGTVSYTHLTLPTK